MKMSGILSGIFFFALSSVSFAQSNCPHYRLSPGQVDVRAYSSISIPAQCPANQVFQCDGGELATDSGKSLDGTSYIAGANCFAKGDPRIQNHITGRLQWPISKSQALQGNINLADVKNRAEEARKAALAKGIPAVVFDRAMANYTDLMKQGKTSRPCFMAADLTTPKQGAAWKICLGTPIDISQDPTFAGTGQGDSCTSHSYTNSSDCTRFFGNKPGYCLSAGGRYITAAVNHETGTVRQSVGLIGLDKDENDNTQDRHIGVQQTSTEDGSKDYVGSLDPHLYSQGSVTIPFRGKNPVDHDMSDFSSANPGGGMALYVYPAKADILAVRAGKSAYWNPTCAKTMQPGWLGTKDSVAPSIQDMGKAATKNLKTNRLPVKYQDGQQ